MAEYYQGDVAYRVIATKGKGERLDRPELEQIEAMLRTRELDLLVAEDIGRMIRGARCEPVYEYADTLLGCTRWSVRRPPLRPAGRCGRCHRD